MRALLIGCTAVLLLAAPPAMALCTLISSTTLAFGNYDVFQVLPTDTAGSLSYTCTSAPGVTFSASINGALNPRQMVRLLGGGDVLRYDIYVDSARTQVWSSTVQVVLPAGIQTIPYYGRADAQQDIQTGTYGDFITITLNF